MRKSFKNHLDNGASACYNIACRSERIGYSSLAQSVERVTVNHDVVGSSPTGGAKEKGHPNRMVFFFASRIVALERVCRFRIAKSAAHSRRRQAHWRLLRRRRRVPTGGAKEKGHPNRMVFFFASRIVVLKRVCRFRIAPQVQYFTVCDSTRFHMRHHRIFHFFRLISPPILQKPFLKYIFVLQAAKNPTCFFFRSLYFLPQIRYTDIGK